MRLPRTPTRPARRVAAALMVAALVAGCGSGPGDPPSLGPAPETATSGTAEPSPPPSQSPYPSDGPEPDPLPRPAHAPEGEHAVGRVDMALVDPDRGTDAIQGRPAREDRRLPVRVLYPARGPSGANVADDAPPADGRFPVVVFSHGLGGSGPAYEQFLGPVAAAGYVVLMPTYPLSSGANASYLDVVNQPADVSFILDELTAKSAAVPAAMDLDRVAVAGHSLGAITSLGVTYGDELGDDRIDAMIGFAGALFDLDDQGYDERPPTPMLLAHGDKDEVLPISGSQRIFRSSLGPTAFLRLPAASHLDLFVGETGALLLEGTLAFLDAHLRDEPAALAAMPGRVEDSGLGTWRTRNAG